VCVGRTGHLTKITSGDRDRLKRLPSIALEDGLFAFGPHDVAQTADGTLYATVGLGGDLAFRESFGPEGTKLGKLVRLNPDGSLDVIADLAAYEDANDPDDDGVDSDAYGLLRLKGRTIVTDAGGNSLLRVTDAGDVSTLAVFPDRTVETKSGPAPMDAVPTTVVRGPDGAFYVGQLTGDPFPLHGARIYRVEPGQAPEVYLRGFTNIIDITFDRAGNLYVLEIAHNSLATPDQPVGGLIRVTPNGDRKTLLRRPLFFPTSVEVMGDRELLVTNYGICPGGGEVLRLNF